jgi:hypothetical protein
MRELAGATRSHPTWGALGQGLLILAALWWAWAAYAWLTNTVDPGEGRGVGCDGGDVRRRAGGPRRLRPPRCRFRGCLPDRERHAPHAVHARSAGRPRPAGGDPADRSHDTRRHRSHHRRGVRPQRASADALAGRRRPVRTAPRWDARLARATSALHRTSRADRDHRHRRVSDRHRARGERAPGSARA